MKHHALSQLSESRLLQATAALVRQGHAHHALLVQHLAEVLRRRAYRPAGYSSMYQYCLLELHLSEASSFKFIWAARLSRRFPGVLEAIAEGRVHLSGIRELARHMTHMNAAELLEAATHRTREEIRVMLAQRFPAPDVLTSLLPVTAPGTSASPDGTSGKCPKQAPGTVVPSDLTEIAASMGPLASHAPGYPRVTPLAPGRFALQVTLSQDAHDLLRRAQELLAHAQPESEIAYVLERALRELVHRLEARKFGDTDAPRARKASCDTRAIPADVRRQVAERDGKRCTFVSDQGVRCEARSSLEYDHVLPFAQGGRSTVANLRLRCRAHNLLAAEQVYGEAFMAGKREQSERRAAKARRAKAAAAERERQRAEAAAEARAKQRAEREAAAAEARAAQRAEREAAAVEKARAKELAAREEAAAREVMPWLRALGFNAAQARRGAEACAHLAEASLEDRVKCAAGALAPRCLHIPAPARAATDMCRTETVGAGAPDGS